jgi:hypothetical protein
MRLYNCNVSSKYCNTNKAKYVNVDLLYRHIYWCCTDKYTHLKKETEINNISNFLFYL